MTRSDSEHIDEKLAQLTLDEKVLLLTGQDAWSTQPSPLIGLRSMVMTDGPSGVRGPVWDERSTSLSLPSTSCLASSWDAGLTTLYGAVAASEARAKGVDVILGPTVNLHRSPLGGRNFEAFSEDPKLAADLATAYVRGVQGQGVAATPKHYVCNDFETERYTVDVQVGERALRELYLLPFERCVTEAHAWAMMNAYNSVNGRTMTESPLLTDPLHSEWGFDGVMVSDWTAVRTIESARHPQDLVMPGPSGPWGEALVSAVQRGDIEASLIDLKVRRILTLADRVGALAGGRRQPIDAPDGVAFARRVAAEGMVLLRNKRLLPLEAASLTRVAVLGESARNARIQGGGSTTVYPAQVSNPLTALREALPAHVEVVDRLGATVQAGFVELAPDSMVNPVTGGPGARVRYLDEAGAELKAEDRFASTIVNSGGAEAIPGCTTVSFATRWTPTVAGTVRLGFAQPGTGRLTVDGRLVLCDIVPAAGLGQIANFFDPDFRTTGIDVHAGVALALEFEYEFGEPVDGVVGSFIMTVGIEAVADDEDQLIADAVLAAGEADVAIVVVGTNSRSECEGFDRSDLRLPGRQDELVAAIAAANPRTIVVVNAGAPVEMPWQDDVAAILVVWFGGQELGHALADVLFGAAEPGGRLPITWPSTLADVPVSNVTPTHGKVRYSEGLNIGYRAWLRAGLEPAYPFGFGLGYTTWAIGELLWAGTATEHAVAVEVTNTGARPGKHVVQVYAERARSAVERPVRWLVGFEVVRLEPGASRSVRVRLDDRAFSHWDDSRWAVEPGEYVLRAGSASNTLGSPLTVRLSDSGVAATQGNPEAGGEVR
jgi:beta-glucosidase